MAGHAIPVRERFSKERELGLWNEAFKARWRCAQHGVRRLWRLKSIPCQR